MTGKTRNGRGVPNMFRPFDYYRARSLQEASSLLLQHEGAKVLAGGTDLLVKLRDGKDACRAVVDIKGIEELKTITMEGDTLSIGALATVTDILESELLAGPYGLLKEAAAVFGCLEIRHRATVGGSIAHASPGGEFGTPLLVLEAMVELAGADDKRMMSKRVLPVSEFITGPTRTCIQPGEVLVRLLVPGYSAEVRSAYRRRSRIAGMDLASMNMAVLITDTRSEAKRQFRVAAGAMAATPIRLKEAEEVLNGAALTPALINRAARAANENLAPRASSLRATPAYKKDMIYILLKRIITELLDIPVAELERR